jgi:hypothetical protein
MFPVSMKNLACPDVEMISTDKTFDILKKEFDDKGYHMASLNDYARIMLMNLNGGICNTRLKEAFIYTPDKVYLSKNSPILANPEQATDCHKKGLEFYLDDSMIKEALRDAREVTSEKIPVSYFESYGFTGFAFGSHARDFGAFLYKQGIKEMSVWLCNNESKHFARQAYLEYRPYSKLFILNSMNLNATVHSIGLKSNG